jgi:HEAT repeat protein
MKNHAFPSLRHHLIPILLTFAVLSLPAFSQESPDSMNFKQVEQDALKQALDLLNITPPELGFDKLYATDDTFRLKCVERLMNDPLSIPDYVTGWGDKLDSLCGVGCEPMGGVRCPHLTPKDSTSAVKWGHLTALSDFHLTLPDFPKGLQEISHELDAAITDSEFQSVCVPPLGKSAKSPMSPNPAMQQLLLGFEQADPWMKKALESLTPSDREAVLMMAPCLWEDEDDSTDNGLKGALHRALGIPVDTSREVNGDTIRVLQARFDRHALLMAGIAIMNGISAAEPYLSQLDTLPAKVQVDGVDGPVILAHRTPWGMVVIGGLGPNRYHGNFAIIIDPGGDDTYIGRTAGAIGELSHSYSIVIDLKGNDTYRSDSTLVTLGAGVLGIGALLDFQGNDFYQGYHLSQGAGMFGIGILCDQEGWDTYRAGYFTQGSGQVGVGWIYDGSGNDVYTIDTWGQGFGSTFGFGILQDMKGCDTYKAGGRYFHHPLRPQDSRSFAQGFGMGFRPRAGGGIGFLYDKEGNDFYNAEVYAQGTSYWYSLGMLLDRKGQDFYNAAQYSQGAGIHLSIGALIDQEGEDHYFSKFGPAQGEGHDFAVGVLIDNNGNDSYMTTGGQGLGLTNSVGIFVDGQGDDVYSTVEKTLGQGTVTPARGFSGAGIFLDLEGFDHYPKGEAGGDSIEWIQNDWGVGIDLPLNVITPEEKEPEIVIQPEDTLRPVKDIFHDASLWEVTENKKKVRTARKALILKGIEAIDYVVKEHLGTDDGLELRAIEDLFNAYPDSAATRILPRLTDSELAVRKNVVYFLGVMKRKEAVMPMLTLLYNKQYEKNWTGVIWALGNIGDTTVVYDILPNLASDKERRRIVTCGALGSLKQEVAIEPLIQMLEDSIFTVRSAAVTALVQFGESAVEPIIDKINDEDSPSPLLLNSLGKIWQNLGGKGGKETEKVRKRIAGTIGQFLDASDPRLRWETVNFLSKNLDKNSAAKLRARYDSEDHPLVKAAIKRALNDFSAIK